MSYLSGRVWAVCALLVLILAACLNALDDAASALPLYRRALEGSKRVLGPEHPDTLTSVNNLAGCLVRLGDTASALPLFRGALEISERAIGPEHPSTRLIRDNIEYLERVASR